jgi:hypothetical protein
VHIFLGENNSYTNLTKCINGSMQKSPFLEATTIKIFQFLMFYFFQVYFVTEASAFVQISTKNGFFKYPKWPISR